MFQYAAGRALSLRLGTSFKLDTRDFSGYKLHQGFELDRLFNISLDLASSDDLEIVLGWQKSKLMKRLFRRDHLKQFRYRSYVVEPQFNYCKEFNQVKDNSYLEGYWQSEKYFTDFAEKIREDFAFKLPFSNQNIKVAEQISLVNAVSLHVRRGDYVNNPKTTETHGLCSLEYYKAAIDYVSANVYQPHFFVFSDDIAWAKANLQINSVAVYVDNNASQESYNDMRLMSLCKHNIIANSSFSWWGAWLNQNAEKIVIAPKQWFFKAIDTADLIPASWVRL